MMSRVLAIGDCHCPGMRQDYVPFLLHLADSWSIDRVVHVGDLVDWASISYHEKNPNLPAPKEEYEKALEQVQSLYEAFPEVDLLLGNHDDLPRRKCITAMMPDAVLRDFSEIWNLPEGWKVHPRFAKLEVDGVLYAHGDAGAGGKYAHMNQAEQNFQSTVIGHFHSLGGCGFMANEKHRIFGMATGCGVDSKLEQFYYGKKYPRKPINGAGVVLDGATPVFEPMLLGKGAT